MFSHHFQRNPPRPKLRQVAANVLFFEPLQDCAGMAASFEILAQSVLPSFFSAFATQSMIHFRDWVLVVSETDFLSVSKPKDGNMSVFWRIFCFPNAWQSVLVSLWGFGVELCSLEGALPSAKE